MLKWITIISLINAIGISSALDNNNNIFGIGVYTDTPGSPPFAKQLELARNLVGENGWVVLYLCAWKHASESCINRSTTHDPLSNEMLALAYAKGLNVIGRIGNPYYVREHSDVGSNYTSYTELGKAYAKLVDSFPLPPIDKKLYIQVGNEFNACNEWKCKGSPSDSLQQQQQVLSTIEIAKEVGGFYKDINAALIPIRDQSNGKILLGVGAIASWTTSPCECSTGRALGKGEIGLKFLDNMLTFYPNLYKNVDFLSSHSYPFSQQPYGTPKAMRGLAYYRNESFAIGRPAIPVHITESGFKRHGNVSFKKQAAWTVKAFQNVWLPDHQLLSVCPFLLAGAFWDVPASDNNNKYHQKYNSSFSNPHSNHGGWTWVNSTTLDGFLVFDSIKNLREDHV